MGCLFCLFCSVARCPEDNEVNSYYGDYLWPDLTPAGMNISMSCVHQCGSLSGGFAIKHCGGFQMWDPTDFSSCPTALTCQLDNISQVHVLHVAI